MASVLEMGACVYFSSHFNTASLSGTDLGRCCKCWYSLCYFIYASVVVGLWASAFFLSSIPFDSYTFLLFQRGLSVLTEGVWTRDIDCRADCSKASYSLHMSGCWSLHFFPSTVGGRVSDDGLNEELISGYFRIS